MATAKIALHKRASKDKTYYIKLQVISDRDKRYYSTTHKKDAEDGNKIPDSLNLNRKFTEKEFNRIMNPPKGARLEDSEKEYQKAYASFLSKANKCINSLNVFTWTAFENLYIKNRGAKDTIKAAYDAKIADLKTEGKIGNAVNYSCAITSIEKYKPDLKFTDITPEFLKEYDKYMRKPKEVLNEKTGKMENKKGASPTTISIYLRTLRTLFNEAIADNLIERNLYPFRQGKKDRRKYSPPAARNIKKALSPEDIGKLYFFESPVSAMQQAKDFWVLSYLCNGMNLKDILNLRWKNIDGDFIRYERAKTQDTKEESETINVHLKDEAKAIIKKYSIKSLLSESLVFPVLNDNMDAETQYMKTQNFVHHVNKNLAKICKDLKIPKATTYSARHSFATTLKKNKASLELIREALGHSSLNTTKNYLASFGDETLKTETDILIPVRQAN